MYLPSRNRTNIINPHSLKRSSYYNPDYRTGAALNRARRPYLFKNMVTGVAIFSFAIGVCMQPNPLFFNPTQHDS